MGGRRATQRGAEACLELVDLPEAQVALVGDRLEVLLVAKTQQGYSQSVSALLWREGAQRLHDRRYLPLVPCSDGFIPESTGESPELTG
jgi:hypothetical protein